MGQHPRIETAKNENAIIFGVGQHPGMVGQHKTEYWVNMEQNLQLQAFLNNKTKFKPTIELTGDIYLEDDKVLRLNPDGSIPKSDSSVGGMVNLFAGSSFHPTQSIYLSFVAGPSFINGQTLLGIKPSLGFYFSKNQKWTGKISYINVFNRASLTKEDFGSLGLAIGIKLF